MKRRVLTGGSGPVITSSDYTIDGVYKGTTTGQTGINYRKSSGWDIPNYRARKNAGELLPFTGWEQEEYDCRQLASTDHVIFIGKDHYRDGNDPLHPMYWDVSHSDMQSLLTKVDLKSDYYVQAAAAKIYGRGWDALTFIAELSQTINMFQNIVQRMNHYVTTGKLHKMWLEGRYGWRTLLYDMQDIEKVISSLDDGRKRYRESIGTTEQIVVDDWPLPDLVYGSRTISFSRNASLTVGHRGTVVADISPPKVMFNPIQTAWEKIPYSFIMDWVVNVGEWIASMSFLALSTDYKAGAGLYAQYQQVVSVDSQVWNPGYSGNGMNFQSQATVNFTLRRPASVSLSPFFRWNLDVTKIMDLVALFISKFTKLSVARI